MKYCAIKGLWTRTFAKYHLIALHNKFFISDFIGKPATKKATGWQRSDNEWEKAAIKSKGERIKGTLNRNCGWWIVPHNRIVAKYFSQSVVKSIIKIEWKRARYPLWHPSVFLHHTTISSCKGLRMCCAVGQKHAKKNGCARRWLINQLITSRTSSIVFLNDRGETKKAFPSYEMSRNNPSPSSPPQPPLPTPSLGILLHIYTQVHHRYFCFTILSQWKKKHKESGIK